MTGILLAHWPASAEITSGSSVLQLEPTPESNNSSQPNSEFIKVQNSQYVGSGKSSYRPGAASQDSSAILGVDDQATWHRILGKIKASDEYSATEEWNYLDIYDLNASFRAGVNQFTLGRKLDNWSEWDGKWGQGEFQPRYLENHLRAQAAGLTGAFYSTHDEHWSSTFGFLPISIPDSSAHFTTENNKFVSQNPWFHSPASEFQFENGIGDIHYEVASTSVREVISHPGVVAKTEYREGAHFSRASLAYKPMPQLLLGFPTDHTVKIDQNSDYMQLTITPRVVYNRVVNFDHQYSSGAWTYSGSVAFDQPEQDNVPKDWVAQQVGPASIFSGSVTRQLEEFGPHSARIELGFLKVNGGDDVDTGRFAGAKTFFSRRFDFYEAYMFAFKKEFRDLLYYPVESELRLIYDRMQGGGVISFNSEMKLDSNWHADLELDFLGLLTSTGTISDGFLSTYRANDRVGLGMSYVF